MAEDFVKVAETKYTFKPHKWWQ